MRATGKIESSVTVAATKAKTAAAMATAMDNGLIGGGYSSTARSSIGTEEGGGVKSNFVYLT